MKSLLNVKNLIIAGLVIAIILTIFRGCHDAKLRNAEVTTLQLEKQRLDSIVNTRNQLIVQQEAIITNNPKALKHLTDSFFALNQQDERKISSVIAYYKSILKAGVDSVAVPYVDTIAQHKFADSVSQECAQVIDYYEHNYISVPRTAEDSTADYLIKIDIRRDSAALTFRLTPDTQQIRFAVFKGGLLKKDIYGKRHFWLKRRVVAQVLHSNKKFEIIGQNSAVYEPKNPPKLLGAAVLVGLGVLLGTQL
jgi:hypothetical protein